MGSLATSDRVLSPPAGLVRDTEVRPVFPDEEEQARALQHAAFGLNGSEPSYGASEQLRGVFRDGRLVSCLTVLSTDLHLAGVTMSMAGVRRVATDPEQQNQGFASALMRDTLSHLRRAGVATSVLFPFSFRYYRKFGYELGGNQCHFWCRPSSIPAYLERQSVRSATPEDAERLAGLYRRRSARSACTLVRPPDRWAALVSDPSLRVLVAGGSDPAGYAVLSETRDSYGGRVTRVLELAADEPAARRGLLGTLSQASAESVEWLAPVRELQESGLLQSTAPLREGFKPRGIATVRPFFQFRVVHLLEALTARLPAFPAGDYRLSLLVRDEQLPENSVPVEIRSDADGPRLGPAAAGDADLEVDVRIFSQIFCGYLSPSEAVSQSLARARSEEAVAVAERLFAAGEPFISELDRF